jgi:hypothetical protein
MNNFTKRLVIGTVAAGTLFATAFTPGAFASDGTSASVSGSLAPTISNPAATDFDDANITGSAQETTADLAAFTATDTTGSGAGWHVTAQATRFTGAAPVTPNLLAFGSLKMSEPGVAVNSGGAVPANTSAVPSITGGPYTLDTSDGLGVVVASAALNEGMGVYDFDATTLTLSLPADVHADVYASTVTISITTAP